MEFIYQLVDKYTLLTGLIVYLLRYMCTMQVPSIQLDSSQLKHFQFKNGVIFLRTFSKQVRTLECCLSYSNKRTNEIMNA